MPLLTFRVPHGTSPMANYVDYNLLENYTLISLAVISDQMAQARTLWQGPAVPVPAIVDVNPPTPVEQAALTNHRNYTAAV